MKRDAGYKPQGKAFSFRKQLPVLRTLHECTLTLLSNLIIPLNGILSSGMLKLTNKILKDYAILPLLKILFDDIIIFDAAHGVFLFFAAYFFTKKDL